MELVVVVVGSVAISASVLALPMIPTIIEREMVMVMAYLKEGHGYG